MGKQAIISLLAVWMMAQGCSSSGGKKLDSPTSGTITVAVDEGLKPLIDAELDVFHALYPKAHINSLYTYESNAVNLLLNDSVRLAIITRDLTAEESDIIKKQGFKARQTIIAYDAIAFILNNENQNLELSGEELLDILAGDSSAGNKPNVVFDNAKSGVLRYLSDSLLSGKKLGKNCFGVNSNPEVIEYVKQHKDAIGIIGASWISDRDDTLSQSFLKTIKVARVYEHYVDSPGLQPYQAYIALKQYPFWRKVVIISKEARSGLGSGFTSFISSEKGQRIILKAGIVPANSPVRLVQTKPD